MMKRSAVAVAVIAFSLLTASDGQGSGPAVNLGEPLFVTLKADTARDHDGDWLKDDMELKIAEAFEPQLIFDSAESARRPNEPITLFQVRPRGCIGLGCPKPYTVGIRYVFLYRDDGGYGPSSDCGDAHHGDNAAATVIAESSDGTNWAAAMIANGHFIWPASKNYGDHIGFNQVQWYQTTHPKIYPSAHKHHQYFDTSWDEDDSVESSWGCNDDVNGLGAKVVPSLRSTYADKRASNVGEPELQWARKCLQWEETMYKNNTIEGKKCVKWGPTPPAAAFFVNDLGAMGMSGEQAWSSAPFCGGVGCDSDETTSVAAMWQTDSFSVESNFDPSDLYGRVVGRVTDQEGKAIPGARLYYRPVIVGLILAGGDGPWSTLPLDATGHYDVRLPFGLYLLRPVASDYQFTSVPKSVEVKRSSSTTMNFVPSSKAEAPTGVTAAQKAPVSIANQKLDEVRTYLLTVVTPNQMVVADPQASDQGKSAEDPFVKLPRRATLKFHVESVLDQSGQPAKTLDEAVCSSKYIKLPDGTVSEPCHLGGPVEGAKIQVRLASGARLVEPQSPSTVDLTTNANGNAYLTLQSGSHPGATRLDINMTANPVNPWAVFSYARQSIELQPALHGDDKRLDPPLALVSTEMRRDDAGWWTVPHANESSGFAPRPRALPGDVNADFVVDQKDAQLVQQARGKRVGQAGYKRRLDINGDRVVDEKDEAVITAHMGQTARPPWKKKG